MPSMPLDKIKEYSEILSKYAEIYSNETRTAILLIIANSEHGVTWKEIEEKYLKIYNVPANPNTIAFNLKRLIDRGIVKKFGDTYILEDKNAAIRC
ncbi:MAG: hypothetical protein ARM1_0626 [Candidatus Micrarchaeota archaeon]|nr:MAG: hypothetical protein ARM1_0626 [Candidatus Micrarchaeota archaeon]